MRPVLGGEFMRRVGIAAFAALVLGGCATTETVQFRTTNPQQQSYVRDGRPALVSRQKNSVVLLNPAPREMQTGGRPVFVLGINNLGKTPVDFRVGEVAVSQIVAGQEYPMQVVTYEMLAQEEKNRQVAMAVLVGVAGAANSYSASQAGRGTYSTPRGHGTYYSPTANIIARQHAAAQNEAMVATAIETGQQNMIALEREVIKDNTLMPGEWYGGTLHLSPPTTPPSGNQKTYTITISVGADRHVIDVAQTPAGS